MENQNQVFKVCHFVVMNECIEIITDYKTLVKNVLLKIQLDTIRLKKMKYLQDLNFNKRTRNI